MGLKLVMERLDNTYSDMSMEMTISDKTISH